MVTVLSLHATWPARATSLPSIYKAVEFKECASRTAIHHSTIHHLMLQEAVSKQDICKRNLRDFIQACDSVVSWSYVFSVPTCWLVLLLILSAQTLLDATDNCLFFLMQEINIKGIVFS